MEKKLAIKGHPSRGKEVIKLLQMMGGENTVIVDGYKLSGYEPFNLYYINDNGVINYKYHSLDKGMIIFTLEEFLTKYPFKVGDKVADYYGNPVTIKSMSWSADCETMIYDFEETEDVLATEDLLKYNAEFLVNKEKSEEVGKMLCDMTLNHLHGNHLKNVLSELYEHIKTTPKEELEREFKEIESEGWTNVGPTVEEFITFCECVNKKPKYPDNYEECVRIAKNIHGYDIHIDTPAYGELLKSFVKLLICRDAYWKIYGEEMELGKPWVPNWGDGNMKFCMSYSSSWIEFDQYKSKHHILAFPTDELRDAFYENFKDLIEECKELL